MTYCVFFLFWACLFSVWTSLYAAFFTVSVSVGRRVQKKKKLMNNLYEIYIYFQELYKRYHLFYFNFNVSLHFLLHTLCFSKDFKIHIYWALYPHISIFISFVGIILQFLCRSINLFVNCNKIKYLTGVLTYVSPIRSKNNLKNEIFWINPYEKKKNSQKFKSRCKEAATNIIY